MKPSTRSRSLADGAVTTALVALLLAAAPVARAGTANAGLPHASRADPLSGIHWGTYTGGIDGVYPAYQAATGRNKRLLAKIALRPLAFWFGAWIPDDRAARTARNYITNVTRGNPKVLVQLTVFRLDPWEQAACSSTPGGAAQSSYRHWIDDFAAGIGSSRVALVLQPDLPFALCAPSGVPLRLVAYAARRFSALPHTTVYIDAGADEWASVGQAASLLARAGVRHARGFALNATQYDSTSRELAFGVAIDHKLVAARITGKRFVINTAENGAPFLLGQYHGSNPANPRVCRNRYDRICATLGIPPTTDVGSRRTGLGGRDRSLASRFVDAYLWIGRPWLYDGAAPFELSRALGMAASSPF